MSLSDASQLPAGQHVLEKQTESTNPDPRHQQRIRLIQALFIHSYDQEPDLAEDEAKTYQQILKNLTEIDQAIQNHAPERPLSEINQLNLAILRLSTYEAHHTKVPTKVVIDEAVELAKEFGTETSPKFINGVLGQMLSTDPNQTKNTTKKTEEE
jgi:N utilization substance protein B